MTPNPSPAPPSAVLAEGNSGPHSDPHGRVISVSTDSDIDDEDVEEEEAADPATDWFDETGGLDGEEDSDGAMELSEVDGTIERSVSEIAAGVLLPGLDLATAIIVNDPEEVPLGDVLRRNEVGRNLVATDFLPSPLPPTSSTSTRSCCRTPTTTSATSRCLRRRATRQAGMR